MASYSKKPKIEDSQQIQPTKTKTSRTARIAEKIAGTSTGGANPVAVNGVLQLQRTIGNQNTKNILNKDTVIQAKLTVGPANDKYEQEADQVAKNVVKQINSPAAQQPVHSFSSPTAQRQGPEEEELQAKPIQRQEDEELLQGKSIKRQPEEEELQAKPIQRQEDEEELLQGKFLQRQSEEEEELQAKRVQRQEDEEELLQGNFLQRQPEEEEELLQGKFKAGQVLRQEDEEELMANPTAQKVGLGGGEVDNSIAESIRQERGSGQPITYALRAPMEKSFGADFSGVRVHTGEKANSLTQHIRARAFTTGQDIFFKNGEYQPNSSTGQQLLAHELTHTMQQGASKRIARWFAAGHEKLTRRAAAQIPRSEVSGGVIDFLARRSGDLDARWESMWNLILNWGIRSPHRRGLYKSGTWSGIFGSPRSRKRRMATREKMWAKNFMHIRDKRELKVHGEAGGYKNDSGANENKKSVDEFTEKAVDNYQKGDQYNALIELSYALHSAEDRGAHGEGTPYRGHDPRIQLIKKMPKGNRMVDNPYYNEKWDPDDPTSNPTGWNIGLIYAIEVFKNYINKVRFLGKVSGKDFSLERPLAELNLSSWEGKKRKGFLGRFRSWVFRTGKLKDRKVDSLLKEQVKLMRKKSKLQMEDKPSKEDLKKIDDRLKQIEDELTRIGESTRKKLSWPKPSLFGGGDHTPLPTERDIE